MSFLTLCTVLGIAFLVVCACLYFRMVIKDKNAQIRYFREMWIAAVEERDKLYTNKK